MKERELVQGLRQRLQSRAEELGFRNKRSLGQNFLISPSVIEKIVNSAQSFSAATILEIGPGLGSLTDFLARIGPRFLLVELDHRLCDFWRAQQLEVLEADALTLPWLTLSLPRPLLLVSNLPYQISSRLVVETCLNSGLVDAMVLMFQKEVAQRLQARVGESDYSWLSVYTQSFWILEKVCEAGPRDFDPPPQVASRVLRFTCQSPTPQLARERYLHFLKTSFAQARQTLVKNLSRVWEKEFVLQCLQGMGFDHQIRPHQISVGDFQRLFLLLNSVKKKTEC